MNEQRCEVDYEQRGEEKIIGYRVSDQYGANIYHTDTPEHPGPTIALRVNLEPVSS